MRRKTSVIKEAKKLNNVKKARRNIFARIADFIFLQTLPLHEVHAILKQREKIKRDRIARRHIDSIYSRSIVIEGIDGMGKQTITEVLKNSKSYHNRVNAKTIIIDYPNYKRWSSIFVRMYLQGKFGKDPSKISPKLVSVCYAFDRWVDYHHRVKKEVYAGRNIIYDRYTTSNTVFQGAKTMNRVPKSQEIKAFKKYYKWNLCLEHVIFGIPFITNIWMLDMTEAQYKDIVLAEKFKNKHNSTVDIHETSNFLLMILRKSNDIARICNWNRVPVAHTKDKRYRWHKNYHERMHTSLIIKNMKFK